MKSAISFIAAMALAAAAFGQADTRPAAHPQPQPGPDPFDKLLNSDGPQDYPAFEMRSVPVAAARAVQTRLQYDRSNVALTGTVSRLWSDMFSAPQYLAAMAEERQAHDRYVAARNEALKSLNENPRYLALIKLRDDLRRKTTELNNDTSSTQEDLLAAATLKLDYAKAASDLEREVLASDSIFQDAQAKLRDAAARRMAMQSSFASDVRKSQDFVAAREMKEDARIRYLVATAFLNSTLENRQLAMRYAYYLHGADLYRYLGGANYNYGYGGYGSSYYGGFGGFGGGYRNIGFRGGFNAVGVSSTVSN